MKRALAKSADNGWAETARMAESCANDIDCFPPKKSSAERRMRATSPKLRVDDAEQGSLISPEPDGENTKEGPLLPLQLCFVARWMLSISGCAIVSFESWFACPPNQTVLGVSASLRGMDLPCRLTISIGHSSMFGRHNWATSSSGKCPAAKLSHPIARAESASACQACPMSCKQYRYARSPYFHASRHTILVKTNTIGAEPLSAFVATSPCPRCSAMCLDGS